MNRRLSLSPSLCLCRPPRPHWESDEFAQYTPDARATMLIVCQTTRNYHPSDIYPRCINDSYVRLPMLHAGGNSFGRARGCLLLLFEHATLPSPLPFFLFQSHLFFPFFFFFFFCYFNLLLFSFYSDLYIPTFIFIYLPNRYIDLFFFYSDPNVLIYFIFIYLYLRVCLKFFTISFSFPVWDSELINLRA